jgi:hypothetical protein
VAAGADVLSISESHHSLEDVYLKLINQDEEASHVLLYMLAIPALVPSFVAAYSVVGERPSSPGGRSGSRS